MVEELYLSCCCVYCIVLHHTKMTFYDYQDYTLSYLICIILFYSVDVVKPCMILPQTTFISTNIVKKTIYEGCKPSLPLGNSNHWQINYLILLVFFSELETHLGDQGRDRNPGTRVVWDLCLLTLLPPESQLTVVLPQWGTGHCGRRNEEPLPGGSPGLSKVPSFVVVVVVGNLQY